MGVGVGGGARYLIDFAEKEQKQNHTHTQNTRWGLDTKITHVHKTLDGGLDT